MNKEFLKMQKLAGLITENQMNKSLNESENLLSLIKDYIDYHYTADQGYGTFTDDETGEEVDIMDNAEKEKEQIKAKITQMKGPEYFELVDKYAGLNTYESEYAGPDDMEELTANKEETASKLGFTVDQLN
jgi:uncharacterized lipoprotein NlpE involved in copper resistance